MCTCPNYMIHDGTFTKNDKPHFKFLGHHQFKDMLQQQKDFNLPYVQVPCGKCLECRIQHARQWADRCVLEAKQYTDNYFITLTYDDDHLPERNSLRPKDLQDFMKRLRYHFKYNKIRFLACGEYGDTSFRPHYHVLLFNCPIDDLSYVFQLRDVVDIDLKTGKNVYGPYRNHLRPTNKGDLMFSKTIYDLWKWQGMISVARFNYDTAAYVSQYVTKKCNPKMKSLYEELNIVPEFLRMSNRPGIGARYFDDHDDGSLFLSKLIIPQDGEAHLSAVPRYFDKLFIKKYGEDVFAPIRSRRLLTKVDNQETILHNRLKDYDRECRLRSYNLKKRQRLRESI